MGLRQRATGAWKTSKDVLEEGRDGQGGGRTTVGAKGWGAGRGRVGNGGVGREPWPDKPP